MKKIIAFLMIFILLISSVVFSGCSDGVKDAENTLKVYLSSLQGFNTNAMKSCVISDTGSDIGFALETMSEGYIQTDKYKDSVENMYKALGKTFEFKINSNEAVDKNTIKFNVTFKYANVDEIAVEEVKPVSENEIADGVILEMPPEEHETKMDKYCREQLEAYIVKHPSMLELNEIDYSDTAISLIASFYKQYLQITQRISSDFDLVLSKRSGDWKIHTEDNKEFYDLLNVLFG